MITPAHIEKARWVLANFSPSELQAYTTVTTPVKRGKQPHSPIAIMSLPVRGARIPASTIARFQSGEYTPRERSLKKLAEFYDRHTYHRLRASGFNKEESRKFRRNLPDTITEYINRNVRNARQMKRNHKSMGRDVPLSAIMWGMAHSSHRSSEWDHLAQISGLQRNVSVRKYRKPKRPAQFEH